MVNYTISEDGPWRKSGLRMSLPWLPSQQNQFPLDVWAETSEHNPILSWICHWRYRLACERLLRRISQNADLSLSTNEKCNEVRSWAPSNSVVFSQSERQSQVLSGLSAKCLHPLVWKDGRETCRKPRLMWDLKLTFSSSATNYTKSLDFGLLHYSIQYLWP